MIENTFENNRSRKDKLKKFKQLLGDTLRFLRQSEYNIKLFQRKTTKDLDIDKKIVITQEMMAEQIDVTIDSYKKWEQARHIPDSYQFMKILNWYELPSDFFLDNLQSKSELINESYKKIGGLISIFYHDISEDMLKTLDTFLEELFMKLIDLIDLMGMFNRKAENDFSNQEIIDAQNYSKRLRQLLRETANNIEQNILKIENEELKDKEYHLQDLIRKLPKIPLTNQQRMMIAQNIIGLAPDEYSSNKKKIILLKLLKDESNLSEV